MNACTYQIGDTVRVLYPEETCAHLACAQNEVPEIALYGGPDPFADPSAKMYFVRIFYATPDGLGATTGMVAPWVLEPAPHHLGDELRKLFFEQQNEIRYMLALRHRGRVVP